MVGILGRGAGCVQRTVNGERLEAWMQAGSLRSRRHGCRLAAYVAWFCSVAQSRATRTPQILAADRESLGVNASVAQCVKGLQVLQ